MFRVEFHTHAWIPTEKHFAQETFFLHLVLLCLQDNFSQQVRQTEKISVTIAGYLLDEDFLKLKISSGFLQVFSFRVISCCTNMSAHYPHKIMGEFDIYLTSVSGLCRMLTHSYGMIRVIPMILYPFRLSKSTIFLTSN